MSVPVKDEEFAQFLLDKGFLLTALEFHQELLEEGTVVQTLQRRFESPPDESNTQNTHHSSKEDQRGITDDVIAD